MSRGPGWGAGPAGAGSAPPSRTFLALLAGAALAAAAFLAADGRWGSAVALAAAAVYFTLRYTGRLGRRREP
jgi:hypothetical protein